MTSELAGGDLLRQNKQFGVLTNLTESVVTISSAADYFYPPNAESVYISWPTGITGTKTIELPHPMRLNDGGSKMTLCVLQLVDSNTDITLTFKRPAAVAGALYNFPVVPINGNSGADFSVSRLGATGSDTRTQLSFLVWCTKHGNYYIRGLADAAAFVSLTAGTTVYAAPASAPSFAAGVWSLNVRSGYPIQFGGAIATNATAYIGQGGVGNATLTNCPPFICSQDGVISQMYAFVTASVAGANLVITVMKNGVATAITGTIPIASVSINDVVNSITVVKGDQILIRTNFASGTANIGTVALSFRPTAA